MFKFSFFFFLLLSSVVFADQWEAIGLVNETINSIAVNPSDPNIILAGGDFLFKTTDGGTSWYIVANYKVNSIEFHPFGIDTVYFTTGEGFYNDGIYKSTDCGESWNILYYKLKASSISIPNFLYGTIIIGSNSLGVFRSDNSGNTFYEMNNNLSNLNVLSVASEDDTSQYRFLAGTSQSIYLYSSNSWNTTNSPNLPVRNISVYPFGAMWSAVNGGSYSDGMYKSEDKGENWAVSHFWVFITDILVNPLDSNIVYASDSGLGVMITTNGGTNWDTINNNLTNTFVYCLGFDGVSNLYAGTGSGVFKYLTGVGVEENIDEDLNIVILYKESQILYWIPKKYENETINIKLYNIAGNLVENIFEGISNSGLNILDINKKIITGEYFLRYNIGEYNIIKKIIVIR